MARIKHGTLVANVVTTVTLDQPYTTIDVLNRDGTAEIYFRLDGADPTVGGDDCQVAPAAIGSTTVDGITSEGPTSNLGTGSKVKLISSGTPKYTVTGS